MKAISPILEVVIAFSLISIILAYILSFLQLPNPETEISTKFQIYSIVDILDKTKNLRKYVLEKNESYVEELINDNLQGAFDITVKILDENESYKGIEFADFKKVIGVPIVFSGDYGNFSIKKLIIFVKFSK